MAERKEYNARMPSYAIGQHGGVDAIDGTDVDDTNIAHAYAGRFPADDRTQDGSEGVNDPRAPELVPDGGHLVATVITEVAGAEGILSPLGVEPYADLAALITGAPTAMPGPGTQWTTDSYITLGDGSLAHWGTTGSAWTVGAAP